MNADKPILARYDTVRHEIRDGDLLLFRRRGLIATMGRTPYCHAAMAAWWDDTLMVLETTAWHGARAVTLRRQVESYPGRIDVYEVNPRKVRPEFNREATVAVMRALCGMPYGWKNVARAALLHTPVLRLAVRPAIDDRLHSSVPFCSQAVAMADRLGGGVDPVPNLADRITEPGDLARSFFYRYRFSLER